MAVRPTKVRNLTNPASRLADLLESFAVPANDYPEHVRAVAFGLPYAPDDDDSVEPEERADFWRKQVEAVDLVREVDSVVQSLAARGSNVSSFEDAIPFWYRAVFGFGGTKSAPAEAGWATSDTSARAGIDPGDLAMLRALAVTLEIGQMLPDAAPEDYLALEQALARADALVDAAQYLPINIRRYLLQLIGEARDALAQQERFGATPARRATFVLAGAMTAAVESGAVDPSEVSKWKDAIRQVVVPLVVAAGIALGSAAGAQMGITSGNGSDSPPATTVVVLDHNVDTPMGGAAP